MKTIVTDYLNRRTGMPETHPENKIGYLVPGNEIEYVDIVPGQEIEGNSSWLKDEAGNFFWSGATTIGKELNPNADPNTELINYNLLVQHIPMEWRMTKGEGVNIAVFDTGIKSSHPDFNGIISNSNTMDFTSSTSGVEDIFNHGTHVSGIIGARSNRANGIVGVAPKCNLFILKVGDDRGDFIPLNIINALKWALSNNIDIINMSFSVNFQRYQSLINTLDNISKIIIVASAGENQILTLPNFFYPAMHPNLVSVGAINQPISVQFNNSLNYIFPFVPVNSCSASQDFYKLESGSSMSAAFISGIICLYLSFFKQSGVQKSIIINELNKYAFSYNNNLDTNKLTMLKP